MKQYVPRFLRSGGFSFLSMLRSMEPRPTTIYCRKMQIFREKILKKFGSSEIMPTFAIPFGKQVVTLLELKIKTSKSDMGNGEIR